MLVRVVVLVQDVPDLVAAPQEGLVDPMVPAEARSEARSEAPADHRELAGPQVRAGLPGPPDRAIPARRAHGPQALAQAAELAAGQVRPAARQAQGARLVPSGSLVVLADFAMRLGRRLVQMASTEPRSRAGSPFVNSSPSVVDVSAR